MLERKLQFGQTTTTVYAINSILYIFKESFDHGSLPNNIYDKIKYLIRKGTWLINDVNEDTWVSTHQ